MKNILVVFLLFSGICASNGQGLQKDQLLVQKEFATDLASFNPIHEITNLEPAMDFRLMKNDSLIRVNPFIPDMGLNIQALKYREDPYSYLQNGFIKAHGGTLGELFIQGAYNFRMDNYFQINIQGQYSKLNEDAVENKSYDRQQGQLDLKYYLKKDLYTDLKISFKKENFGLYGFEELRDANELQQNEFSQTGIDLGITSFKMDPERLNFSSAVSFNAISANQNISNEISLLFKNNFHYSVSEKVSIELQPIFSFNEVGSTNKNYLTGRFLIGLDDPRWSVKMGVVTHKYPGNFHFFPDLNSQVLISDVHSFQFSVGQKLFVHNLLLNKELNPFIRIPDYSSDYHLRQSVRASFEINFKDDQLRLAANWSRDMKDVNFYNSSEDARLFDIQYVDYQKISISMDYKRNLDENFADVSLMANYNHYSRESAPLFYRPELEISPTIHVHTPNRKLNVIASMNFESGSQIAFVPYKDTNAGIRKAIDIEANARINNKIKVYLNVSNLLNDDYSIWNGYSPFGRNLSGGLLMTF